MKTTIITVILLIFVFTSSCDESNPVECELLTVYELEAIVKGNTLTLLDFPGKVSCIIFTAGCNFRCGFCHNPQFVLTENIKKLTGHFIPEEKILSFLDSRKGFLDGIVISPSFLTSVSMLYVIATSRFVEVK